MCVCVVCRVFGLSGNIYTGQFRRGEPYGQGLMRSPDGEQFEGDFREGRREGEDEKEKREGRGKDSCGYCLGLIQWNPSNPDTNGTEEIFHISEVFF